MLRIHFGIFSALAWKTAGFDPAVDKGEQRFTDLMDNLELLPEILVNNKPILRVATIDPVKQVSMILSEGLIFMKALKKPAGLKYLSYHTQAVFSDTDPNKDHYTQIIISAFVAASKTTVPRFAPLKASLAEIPFPLKIKDYAEVKKLIEQKISSTFDPNLFAEFVNTIGKQQWTSWQPHRANLSRYNILLDYYEKLMA